VHLIPAVTDPHAPSASVATFATASDSPGLSTSRMGGLGCRAAAMGDLVLDGVRVDDSRRIDAEGRGSADLEHVVDRGRIALAALALGLGEGALAAAAGYAKDRTQFGQPIADFQAIQWMIADARAGLDSARMLVRRGAWIADRGDPLGQAAAQARLRATEAASSACHQALQVHGGYGYTREFPVERLLRDVTVCRTALGGTDPDRQDVARSILEA
jgi:alkylation response protein AidB-like acyl-CoA dehydrogenase